MNLENHDFWVRTVKDQDRDKIREIEFSMPWIRKMPDKDLYFENLWNAYVESDCFWIVEHKMLGVVAYIELDKDTEREGHFYIHLQDPAKVIGFGEQMLDEVIADIGREHSISDLFIEMWDENDPSMQIYEEAGHKLHNGYLEININSLE